MGIFNNLFKKEETKEPEYKEIPKDSGCHKCYNYNHQLCHGRYCTCEAFRANEEDTNNNRSVE